MFLAMPESHYFGQRDQTRRTTNTHSIRVAKRAFHMASDPNDGSDSQRPGRGIESK